jgi:hypothetical protein
MIWRRLKKSTPQQEKEFAENLSKENVGFKDRLAMYLSAILVLVLPALAVVVLLSLLVLWIFGAF